MRGPRRPPAQSPLLIEGALVDILGLRYGIFSYIAPLVFLLCACAPQDEPADMVLVVAGPFRMGLDDARVDADERRGARRRGARGGGHRWARGGPRPAAAAAAGLQDRHLVLEVRDGQIERFPGTTITTSPSGARWTPYKLSRRGWTMRR